jgi:anti-sigma B factor antagonist
MFDIKMGEKGRVILVGRLDASQENKANAVFDGLQDPCVIDMKDLEYISSLGLGILVRTQKRIKARTGGGLRLVNVNRHINELFRLAGFHQIFEIESPSA